MAATMTITWPRLTRCRCGETILQARHQGESLRLDPLPVLPEGKCGTCNGRGTQPVITHATGGRITSNEPGDLIGRTTRVFGESCIACKGTGRRGEPLTVEHVLVTTDGVARPYDGTRERWEAAHRRHRCGDTA